MIAIYQKLIVRTSAAFLLLFITTAAYSDNDQPPVTNEGKAITAISVRNNKTISAETILSKIRTKPGDKFSQEVLNDDLKKLYATQYFTDISIDVEDSAGGVSVAFVVEEKPVIDDIVFKGNNVFRPQKLKTSMKSKPNEMLNLSLLAQDISEIKAMYVKKGYPQVDVKYTIDTDKETNKAVITIAIDEKLHVKVASVKISGNKAVKTKEIKRILGTKPAWLFNPGVFNEETLQDDIDKIKALYDDIGFMDAEVIPHLDHSEEGRVLAVDIEVKEGKQYLVGDITFSGALVYPEKEVRKNIFMKKGKPFSTRALREDIFSIRQFYYKYGYMNVIIDVEKNLNPQTSSVDIAYNIDPKEVVYVGKIDVRGNLKTRDVVVRRELRLFPGDKFSGDKIRRSKERLYNLGFFENVSFDTEPTEDPNVQNLVVNVKETKTGEFSFGGGYSSIDMLMGFAEITQRNFDILNFPTFTGGGQSLTIKGEIGMVRSNYNIGWSDPWIFGFPFLGGFDVYRTSHDKDSDVGWSYDETRTGGDLKVGKEFTDTFRGDIYYRVEDVKISNLDSNVSQDMKDEEGSNIISSMTFGVTQDTRDNIYTPSKGYVINGTIEDAGGVFGGDKNFWKGTASASIYYTIFDKIVLEGKARMGFADAYGNSNDVPIYERFYAGGANTIRGYRERYVGPRDSASNDPIGGNALLIGNAEVTFPVYEKIIKGAVFYDVGNVWRKIGDFADEASQFKAGVGVGVRVKTPLGPVKVDYGYPLSKNHEDKREGQVYFSMSRGF
ncbi:MAG: outer membrane protein assembly factor BamA [Candidatus Omnitrophica bacterium]|nr:outer membrane protein assembly factor BamA [Candidatus Omnitrophota bacterium]